MPSRGGGVGRGTRASPTEPSGESSGGSGSAREVTRRRLDAAFLRYFVVGVGNSLLDLGLFSLFTVVAGITPLLANVASTTITICVSYVLNRLFVFRTSRSVRGTVVTFVAVTLGSALVIQSAVIWSVIALGHATLPTMSDDLLAPTAKVCAMGAGMVSNFLGYRWLFRTR